MIASTRAAKPKLSLNITTASQSMRPPLTVMMTPVTPLTPLRSPIISSSPIPHSPTARHTLLNKRGLTTLQQPTYSYANNSTSKSILKRRGGQANAVSQRQRLQFSDQPTIHCVTPIEEADYYGGYKKMSREERRWVARP